VPGVRGGALGHTITISCPGRAALLAAALASTLALGGCGGIEFQGKIFDYVGLSGDRQEPDPRLAERPPLLLPPDTKALPPPGSGVAVATAREDWPQNPELVQKQIVKAKEAEKSKEEAANDPINPYAGKPTLLDKWLGRKKEPEQVDDVPEPYTYALTNRRFLIIRGIFARKIVTAPLTAITHVTVEQSFWQRFLFNTGHLVIITAGFDQREIVIEHVGNPVEFKVMIEELTERIEETWEGDSESGETKLRSLST